MATLEAPRLPYIDAEKGLVDHHSSNSSVSTLIIEKSGLATSASTPDVKVVVDSKEAVVPKPTSPPVKPRAKKQVSKIIVFVLWFNTYRKFFTVVFTLNLIGLGLAASGYWPYAVQYTSALVLGNLHVAILVRNEIFGRFLYLTWTPLWFRLGCTSVLHHLGGIHSGCALSSICWLVFQVVNNCRDRINTHNSVLVLGILTNVALVVAAAAAIPWVRNTHHNIFERHHRFAGWTALVLTWAFTLAGDMYNPSTRQWNISGVHIVKQQNFWFVLLMSAFIIAPWACTRKVPVDIELPSPKVAIVRFQRGMQQGLLGRVGRSAVLEYHAFGIISVAKDAEHHYMICGVQGDFTKSLVNDPPTHLWTRELKFAGVSNTSTLYKRGIRICTGTGIGAALSTCIQSPNWFLIWIGSDQEKTFGPTISALIHENIGPERLLLWDSKQRGGRPDTMKLLKETCQSWGAEVVFITSNYQGNTEMMQGCKEAGIPVFGTLWDF